LAFCGATDDGAGEHARKLCAFGRHRAESPEILGDLVKRLGTVCQLEKSAGIAPSNA
jgi:hypothetical protein